MKDLNAVKGHKADTNSLDFLKFRLARLKTDSDWKGYALEIRKLARSINKPGDPDLLEQSLDICLAGISQLVACGRTVSARATLDLLWQPIKLARIGGSTYSRILHGWALTILGDIESDSLAFAAAHKAYRKAVAALSYPDAPLFYLPNAMIRKGATELALGKTATARKTLESARVLVQQHIDDKQVATYTVLQLATILSLLGYTWLLSGRNFAKANDLFTQSCNVCRDSSDREIFPHEFALAEASALSGISSLDFLQNRRQQAGEQALQVANVLREMTESVPDDAQIGFLASKALVKLAAITYDPVNPEKTSKLFEDADRLLSHLEQVLERPEPIRHAHALSRMVRAGIARKHNDIVTVKPNAFTAINIWKKLITKVSEPEFIADECERLCGLDLMAPGHNFIRLSDVKLDEPIRGKFAVLQARTPVADIADMMEILAVNGTLLADTDERRKPNRLLENRGSMFKGYTPFGNEFLIAESLAMDLCARDNKNITVVRPFMTRREVNREPIQTTRQYAIFFDDMNQGQAQRFEEPYAIVEKQNRSIRTNCPDKIFRDEWWRFSRPRPELRMALNTRSDCFVVAGTSKYLSFLHAKSYVIFSETLEILTTDRWDIFSVVQSTIHEIWARQFSNSVGPTLRYSPTACFETFVFPKEMWQSLNPLLAEMGQKYHELRQHLMLSLWFGLTDIYDLFHSRDLETELTKHFESHVIKNRMKPTIPPEHHERVMDFTYEQAWAGIQELRSIHIELDNAVRDAYGWQDLDLGHNFYKVETLHENELFHFTISPIARKELLNRLLRENKARAAAEADFPAI